MRVFLFLILSFNTLLAQDFAKDSVMGTQPITILKLNKTKLFIVQNKELQKPYVKQKDGSFISNGMPWVQIHIDKTKHTMGNTNDYIDVLFDKLSSGSGGSNEIINLDNTRVLLQTRHHQKDKKMQLYVFYPLSDRFMNVNFVFAYTTDADRKQKIKGVEDIIKNGLIVLEDYFTSHKI
ncbi:hypothetical protein BWK63_13970 [Flavobacterium covae]|uniref:Uncharacterized protein n=1 Tax=Flavobacterium covae TaxID=2906076 RepID=A0ABW8PJW6_9FLAO|nr:MULTISPECIES: hypothetical protein [Flavobacterium]OWP79884.1 hypothetical protein BWK63_13970 [Flavobacterium covae]POR17567.1 hypothetical protein BWK57_14105 [Flavobacterium columnare]